MKKILIFILLLLSGLFGCANPTKDMTEAEKEQYFYEREVRRLEERDKIRQFIANCKAQKKVIVYQGYDRIRRKDEIPRHARLNDYQCATAREVMDALRRSGMHY